MIQPDKVLVENLKHGDDRAFKIVFDHYFIRLFHYAFHLIGCNEDARDLVQISFIKLWENKENLLPNTNIESYLYTITRNACLDFIKHMKIKEQYQRLNQSAAKAALNDNSDDVTDYIYEAELNLQIQNAIQELPLQRRRIFEMSRFDGMKYQEIADNLGISIKTVETQISRALVYIKNKLKHFL